MVRKEKNFGKPVAWRWRDTKHQAWNFIDFDPVNMDYVFVEPLYVNSPSSIEALMKIQDAALGGYLTPNLCAKIVDEAIEEPTQKP